MYTTVEGLLQKIEHSLRDANPFLLGDSSKLHHDDDLKEAKMPDRFEEVMSKLKDFYSGPCFFNLFDFHIRSFISFHSDTP